MKSFESTLESLLAYRRETALLESAQAALEWDERTGLPVEAGEYRAAQVTLLSGLIHQRNTSPQYGQWLNELSVMPSLIEDPHSELSACVLRLKKDFDRDTKLPLSLVEASTKATMLGQQAWSNARSSNDFPMFAPFLAEILRLKREEASLLRRADQPLYDSLLDQYEEDAESVKIRQAFQGLRDQLVPLVSRCASAKNRPKIRWTNAQYDQDGQRRASRWIAEQIGFDFQRGRLDETDHPFCTTLGPSDHRILTRYNPNHFNSGFYGTLHEAGHGMYEQGLPIEWFGLPAGTAVSLGIHESQSRFWENVIGRSRAFWTWALPKLQPFFPGVLDQAQPSEIFAEVNCVEPSLIRVEADEVTYNLHIMIRFELEQELLEDRLSISDLPEAWNTRYEQYLGIRPPNDADGVLQDIHWSAGLIGYFPTYTLGNLYAAQLTEAMQQDLGPWIRWSLEGTSSQS